VALIWLAAPVALDAPSESYLMNLGAASQAGGTLERIHGVLTALAPIVGTPRVVSASFKISDMLRGGACIGWKPATRTGYCGWKLPFDCNNARDKA
jgi:hypothetical protein